MVDFSAETYTYSFSRLASRDEVVFKSIVRLLTGKSHYRWQHVLDSSPDLLIVGGEQESSSASADDHVMINLIITSSAQDKLTLRYPLRASEVLERLEQAGRLLTQRRPAQPLTFDTSTIFKLKYWPNSALLQCDANYIRLATLLSARGFNHEELVARSGVSALICQQFLDKIIRAGLVSVVAQAPEVQAIQNGAAKLAPHGFFARVRAHFGLPAVSKERI